MPLPTQDRASSRSGSRNSKKGKKRGKSEEASDTEGKSARRKSGNENLQRVPSLPKIIQVCQP